VLNRREHRCSRTCCDAAGHLWCAVTLMVIVSATATGAGKLSALPHKSRPDRVVGLSGGKSSAVSGCAFVDVVQPVQHRTRSDRASRRT
jgi:hypothetical protein